MKKITLLISDRVYKELMNSQSVRMLAGSAYGIQDSFMKKLISSIEEGKTEVEIKYKDEGD